MEFFRNLISNILANKKYLAVYIVAMLFFIVSFFNIENYSNPKAELIIITVLAILGISCILYSIKHIKEIHKIAVLIILIFGVLCVFLSPIYVAPDETGHFARSEITSEGILFPEYDVQNKGYYINTYFLELFNNWESTILDAEFTHSDIGDSKGFFESLYSQNLFYAYLAQALGILLAKCLDLHMIWTLWLGRLFNLILYTTLAYFAIKKIPTLKLTLLVIACLPLVVFQASSMSPDSFVFGMGLINIAYFIYMYKSENPITNKDLAIFFISGLLIGLLRVPYSFLLLLILLIPSNNFKSTKISYLTKIMSFLIIIGAMAYSLGYASKEVLYVSRAEFYITNNINPNGQLEFILLHLNEFISMFLNTLGNSINTLFITGLYFYHNTRPSGEVLFNILFFVFFITFSLFSESLNLNKNKKIGIILIFLLVYGGTFFTQYLSWKPIGFIDITGMDVLGVQARYFVPILILIPMVLGSNLNNKVNNLPLKTVLAVIIFLSGMILLTTSTFY